jgi:hypothetical protein
VDQTRTGRAVAVGGLVAIWIKIGVGENLAMTVNGVRVDNLPGGVANVVATRGGVRPT